jgi:hypothetical protein
MRRHSTFFAGIPDHITAIAVGLDVAIVAVFMGSGPWLALGTFVMSCGVIDGMQWRGVIFRRAGAYALDCLLLAAVFLVLCLFKPACSDAPHELD